jgi:hypothetical protein
MKRRHSDPSPFNLVVMKLQHFAVTITVFVLMVYKTVQIRVRQNYRKYKFTTFTNLSKENVHFFVFVIIAE